MQEHTDKKKPFISQAGVVLICGVLTAFFFPWGLPEGGSALPGRLPSTHWSRSQRFWSALFFHEPMNMESSRRGCPAPGFRLHDYLSAR